MRVDVLICLIGFVFISCMNIGDKREGEFGTSDNISISKSRKLYRAMYIPNLYKFQLLDKSIVSIDTAWAEAMWTYNKNGNPVIMEKIGYNFVIPIKKQDFAKFLFDFSLADTNNQAFTNGIEARRCVLNPKILKDTINVIVEEKNPDTAYGWIKPIITGTIRFIKRKI